MNLMFQPLRKYADFNGRARRAEYWLFTLLMILISLPLSVISGVAGAADETGAGAVGGSLILLLVMLGLIIPSIAVTVRRLHDTNRSGWWILISFIPLVGGLILFVFSVLDGTPGPNNFGPDPKGRGDTLATVFA
ncbi:DUF805 domain-containing protein [Phenylobacterium sp.]|jgi:uncharacterized membrane protein YhaH (DUF805 family)|uniref:DUF805 domain-containing protein n=1 Tax=Phenylobacterium sp. TaxID=1871053 RepID=UPI002E3294AE|nr:DUF805 domain-containing protein [Phenylobacterium sp.]HEX2559544.1 DUF805 domain-containing protein [Phenylobacterium sp.]